MHAFTDTKYPPSKAIRSRDLTDYTRKSAVSCRHPPGGKSGKHSGHKEFSFLRKSSTVTAQTSSSELPKELHKLVTTFSAVPDAKLKYQQLLYLGKKLPPLPQSDHTQENKVRGCVSQVWVLPECREGKVYWKADSDSLLTKGLAALLVQGLSDCKPEEIVRIQPDFIEKLGLSQALTPSRNNGFLNMFKLMQAKSLELLIKDN